MLLIVMSFSSADGKNELRSMSLEKFYSLIVSYNTICVLS
jgi:hypothetical protein